jgi:spore coat polysaccharide biosynthesis protein SpsF
MKVLTILQARMSSSRLPGKVMRPILGTPMMGRQIERLRRSRSLGELVVATSTDASDDVVADYAASLGCGVHRGSLQDVLARYVGAAAAFGPADHVVRVTADCPLADWSVIDACIALHLESGADYTSNTVERTYPKGLDVEVVKARLLPVAAAESNDPYDHEHVTPYFYRNPQRFGIQQLVQSPDHNEIRWTVDYPEDFEFVTRVYEALYPAKPYFSSADIYGLGWTLRRDVADTGPSQGSRKTS